MEISQSEVPSVVIDQETRDLVREIRQANKQGEDAFFLVIGIFFILSVAVTWVVTGKLTGRLVANWITVILGTLTPLVIFMIVFVGPAIQAENYSLTAMPRRLAGIDSRAYTVLSLVMVVGLLVAWLRIVLHKMADKKRMRSGADAFQ